MSRITKEHYKRLLEAAIWHQKLPRIAISRGKEIEVRDSRGFVDVAQYSYGQIPADGEIGRTNSSRFFVRTRVC